MAFYVMSDLGKNTVNFQFLNHPRRRALAAALAIAFATTDPSAIAHVGQRDFMSLATPRPSGNAPIVVQNCDDSGPGSLRDAYFNAVDGDTIDLTQLTCSTITLTSGALTNSPSATQVMLEGPGKYALTIHGNHNGRVLVHNGSGQLELIGLTIAGGSYSGGSYGGGCIYSYGSVLLELAAVTDCSLSSSGTNKAYGGAIYARDSVLLGLSNVTASTAHAQSANSAGGGVWAKEIQTAGSTISGNTVSGDGSHYSRGGGLFALGDVTIKYSTISDNEAETGAGIFLLGAAEYTMEIQDCTITGNRASGAAGGVYSKYRPLQIANSTITSNTSGFPFGAGLYLASNTELESTIVANNTSGDGLNLTDIAGVSTITLSGANNLIMASTLPTPSDTITLDPMLGPLQNNGGYTLTQAPLPGSPVIDAGNNVIDICCDQRLETAESVLFERSVGLGPDIGAFETGAPDRIFTDGFDNEI